MIGPTHLCVDKTKNDNYATERKEKLYPRKS